VIPPRDTGSDTESAARRDRAWPPREAALVEPWLGLPAQTPHARPPVHRVSWADGDDTLRPVALTASCAFSAATLTIAAALASATGSLARTSVPLLKVETINGLTPSGFRHRLEDERVTSKPAWLWVCHQERFPKPGHQEPRRSVRRCSY